MVPARHGVDQRDGDVAGSVRGRLLDVPLRLRPRDQRLGTRNTNGCMRVPILISWAHFSNDPYL